MDEGSGRELTVTHAADAGEYLDQVGAFLRREPVRHSVLLNTAATHAAGAAAGIETRTDGDCEPNLWLWVEAGDEVVVAAQHTAPFGAYLSTGPAEAVRRLARVLRELRPRLPGVGGLRPAPEVFADEWARLGGPVATLAMSQALYVAEAVRPPDDVPGRLRPAGQADVTLLRSWVEQFVDQTGTTPSDRDAVGPRIDAGLLFVWDVGGQVVSMAAVTAAQADVSRVQLVYTPPEYRRQGFASACVAAVTARELATPGRGCMLYADLANPTSNSVYQAVGYRRVADAVDLRFDSPTKR